MEKVSEELNVKKKSSLKSTIAVSLTNYLDAGAIVAGASGLTLWKDYLGLTEGHLGCSTPSAPTVWAPPSVPSSVDSWPTGTVEKPSIPTTCSSTCWACCLFCYRQASPCCWLASSSRVSLWAWAYRHHGPTSPRVRR